MLGSQVCCLPGCRKPTQKSLGSGYSPRYCKHHVEFHRRHGSYWFKSISANELKPLKATAKRWIKTANNAQRISVSVLKIEALLQGAGRAENAYSLSGRKPKARAQIALARLRDARVDPVRILERIIAIAAYCQANGIDERQREYRQVQMAKSFHRLASGTHKTTSGFPLPSKYPRSEGQVLRHIGKWLDDIASFAIGDQDFFQGSSDA